jgi:SAM-dependent methyltransferase
VEEERDRALAEHGAFIPQREHSAAKLARIAAPAERPSPGVPASPDLQRFYEDAYTAMPGEGERYARWRALGAKAKADHVVELSARIGLTRGRVVEVGCGDGALLAELAARGFAHELAGFDISRAAVDIVRDRDIPGLTRAETFDGARLPLAERSFDLALLFHVLEHVPEPAALLAEAARVSSAVVLEVPLEENLSARRASKRRSAEEIGHLQRLDRAAVGRIVRDAGLMLAAELADPLTLEVHSFFAENVAARLRAGVKAAIRRSLYSVAPRAAERLFTVHYACACVPA